MIKNYNVEDSYKLYASYNQLTIPQDIIDKLFNWGLQYPFFDKNKLFDMVDLIGRVGYDYKLNNNLNYFKNFNFFKNKKGSVKVIINKILYHTVIIIYFKDDTLNEIYKSRGPAAIEYNYECNKILREVFFKNGKPHRDNGPQEIFYFKEKVPKIIVYRKNGLLHREKEPAFIVNGLNGSQSIIEKICYYYLNGENFRENNKPHVEYYKNKKIFEEIWLRKDIIHRLNGPAIIKHFYNNIKKTWYINGKKLNLKIFPAFENNKKINKVLIKPHIVLKGFELDREYGNFLKDLRLSGVK